MLSLQIVFFFITICSCLPASATYRLKTELYLWYTLVDNMFIYQARGVQPGPSRVSDSPVSAEKGMYEDLVLMGELR